MAGEINRVIAKGVSGIYKDKDIEIGIGTDSADTYLKVNGKKVELVQCIHISMRLGKMTTVIIEKLKGGE